jgi:tRNA A37 threonylcarbamoyladenosine synthetase subunit TsaC/SUA5/YrdC
VVNTVAFEQYNNRIETLKRRALRLSSSPHDLSTAAELISKGKFGIIAFKGIYGLFGHADQKAVTLKIIDVKERPEDTSLILTTPPRNLHEHVDFSQTIYTKKQIEYLQTKLHALGVILPASPKAPRHLVSSANTVLNIWAEGRIMNTINDELVKLGIRGALVGTSANKHGMPTIYDTKEVWEVFGREVDFIVQEDDQYEPKYHLSTSVINMCGNQPVLHRLGSTSPEEIQDALIKAGIKEPLHVDERKMVVVKKNEK